MDYITMNYDIFYFFNNLAFQYESLDTLIIFIADWLIWWLMFILAVLFFLKKISLKSVAQILAAAILAWLISRLIKYFYFSPRPFELLENAKILFTHGQNDSCPSGNTTFASALAVATYLYANKKIGVLFLAGAVLIGLSRIIVGIHWPSDILAGLAVGIMVPAIFYFFHSETK